MAPFYGAGISSPGVCAEPASSEEEPKQTLEDKDVPEDNTDEAEPPTDEEEDYLMVRNAPTIPTMDSSFKVN